AKGKAPEAPRPVRLCEPWIDPQEGGMIGPKCNSYSVACGRPGVVARATRTQGQVVQNRAISRTSRDQGKAKAWARSRCRLHAMLRIRSTTNLLAGGNHRFHSRRHVPGARADELLRPERAVRAFLVHRPDGGHKLQQLGPVKEAWHHRTGARRVQGWQAGKANSGESRSAAKTL